MAEILEFWFGEGGRERWFGGGPELDALIRRLADSLGVTFVIVTHELASIYAIADRIIMLDKRVKGIIADGDPRRLRDESTDPYVRQFFHRQAELADA